MAAFGQAPDRFETETQTDVEAVESDAVTDEAESREPSESEEDADVETMREAPEPDVGQRRVCQDRAEAINQLIDRQTQRLGRFYELIGNFVDDVVSVKAETDLEVDGHDVRMDDIEAQTDVLGTSLEELEELADPVDCENPAPVEHIGDYIGEYRQFVAGLDEYRTLAVEMAAEVHAEWVSSNESSDAQDGIDDQEGDIDEDE